MPTHQSETDKSPTKPRSSRLDRYGPWAVITGASDGIGRAIATELAGEGFSLVLVARRKAILSEFAEDLAVKFGTQTRVIPADLGSKEGIRSVEVETKDLDVGLIVAAAGFGTSGPFLDGDLDAELDMISVNCEAIAALTHVFARRFVERGCGGIILMSSLVAFQGVPRATNYSATKAYVQSFAEGLAVELSPYGVDVVASAPGPVRSGFDKRAGMTLSMAQPPSKSRRVRYGPLDAASQCVPVS